MSQYATENNKTMGLIADNTKTALEMYDKIMGQQEKIIEALGGIKEATASYPRELQAHVSFQEIDAANAQAGYVRGTNTL